NDVARQRPFLPRDIENGLRENGQPAFEIDSAAAPYVSVLDDAAARVHRPLLALYAHNVRMPRKKPRSPAAVAAQPRNAVRLARLGSSNDIDFETEWSEFGFQNLSQLGFVAERIARVNTDYVGQQPRDLRHSLIRHSHGNPKR